MMMMMINIFSLLTYSKQIAIYKVKLKKKNY